MTAVITDFATIRMYGLQLEPAVAALVAEGALPANRLNAVVPMIEEASASGDYYCIVTMHLVSGLVSR